MERWHALCPNWALTLFFVLIVTLNVLCSYYGFSVVTKTMTLSTVPIVLILYFYKQRIMANIFSVIFALYFLGIIFNAFDQFSLSTKFSEWCFTGAYLLMVFVMLGKLKGVKLEGFVSWYLIVVFFISTYFVFLLFTGLKGSFQDTVILSLMVSKGVVLLVMAFLAFAIYLSKETAQSIIFLTVVCCFIFSDVSGFITTSYVQFWLFEAVQSIFQSIGLFMACIYVYNHHQPATRINGRKVFKSISHSSQMSVQS
ncbi:hypothetical protein [Gelidibacter sp.]|uniref:hypothetical protein n=1 Tax=Gelidibacter sp. TaxID=2018083 RepID=UPI002B57112C|nr:hypothetical protein [Gelidibacter sp.]HUH27018.1 hypothetical protein [Gelidibacter sp.]